MLSRLIYQRVVSPVYLLNNLTVMSIVEIETAISKLPPEQVDELMSWLEKHYSKI
jgi:hypothetical protein